MVSTMPRLDVHVSPSSVKKHVSLRSVPAPREELAVVLGALQPSITFAIGQTSFPSAGVGICAPLRRFRGNLEPEGDLLRSLAVSENSSASVSRDTVDCRRKSGTCISQPASSSSASCLPNVKERTYVKHVHRVIFGNPTKKLGNWQFPFNFMLFGEIL